MKRTLIASCFIALGSLGACTHMDGYHHAAAPAMTSDGVLTNSAGMTLYTFDNDPAGGGRSMCNGPCADNWPPLMAGSDAKAMDDWSLIKRDDGSMQWAYKGKPLYLWIKDGKPGERTGDGFKGVWHVARP
jgi:predicted lipoprotein with Yx(FWY)xxD motif